MLPITLRIYLIATYSSLAGMLYGLDSGFIGSATRMVQFSNSIGHISPSQLGIFVASIMLSAFTSSLFSGHVADVISRKYDIAIGGLIVAIGSIISASVNSFPALVCARLVTGIGHGQSISMLTTYLCEVAPKDIRGTVATMHPLLTTVGVASGYFIAYGSSRLDSSLAWRIPFIVQACLAAMLSIGMTFMPFSPRWLVQHGRFEEARDVLSRLRQVPENVDEELNSIRCSLEDGTQQASFSEVFSKRYIRRSLLGIFLMAFQMLCGMEAVLYYAPTLFTQAGFSSRRASFLASGISGIINIAFTIPGQLLVDRSGRRFSLIGGGTVLASCFLAIGSIYATHGGKVNGEVYLDNKSSQWAVITLIYIFVATYSWSWSVVIRIYACEIVPTHLRAKACALQQVANWIVKFTVALTTPLFLHTSASGLYFFSGSFTCSVALVCYFFMPETQSRSLEEIDVLFEKKSCSGRGIDQLCTPRPDA